MSAVELPTSLQPLATSVTSPSTQTQGKVVTRRVLHLSDIPGAMDKMGWTVAAKLMRHWFSIEPAWEMPLAIRQGGNAEKPMDPRNLEPSQYDDRTVTMRWLMQFPRAASVVRDLVENWNSQAGRQVLQEKLRRAGWTPNHRSTFDFGQGIESARELDSVCQVNFRALGGKNDSLDDLYGALGLTSLKAAVVGRVLWMPSTQRHLFEPIRLGIFVRDTFDFTSTSFEAVVPLGIWSRDRCLSKAEMASYLMAPMAVIAEAYDGFVPVFNRDFRRWQHANGTGGDFAIYSDVKWIPVSTPSFVL
jgi:hypothetical protein